MAKTFEMTRTHDSCEGLCRHVVGRPAAGVSGSAGSGRAMRNETSGATRNHGDARRVRMSAIAFLRMIGLYRERVDLEIGRASEHGARWWTSRLVELCEKVGWVRLDQ